LDDIKTRNHGKPVEHWTERSCIDCNESTLNDERCRDCDIEWSIGINSCRECSRWLKREDWFGPVSAQHADGCSLAHDPDPYPAA
jgi:hypothetical protein